MQMVRFHYRNVRAAFYLNLTEFNSQVNNRRHEEPNPQDPSFIKPQC